MLLVGRTRIPALGDLPSPAIHPSPSNDQFQLKHIFHHGAGSQHYQIHRRLDITPEFLAATGLDDVQMSSDKSDIHTSDLEQVYAQNDWPEAFQNRNPWTMRFPIKSGPPVKVQRLAERHTPNFIDSYLEYAINIKGNPRLLNMINLEWEQPKEISFPDVSDKDTLVSLALISSNAYVRFPKSEEEKRKSDWTDLGEEWQPDQNNSDLEFGWDGEGLRGHVFVNEENHTVVIGFKGTSGAGIPGAGEDETTASDKLNDNLLFSCCCARLSYLWTTVCDCYEKAYTCNQDCLEKELVRKDRFYQAVLDVYRNVTAMYNPDVYDIWLTGHSLGGALASLLGRTYGLPVVAFEAPGEMLASQRLHLPQPPGFPRYLEHIYHIGNTADPIFMGSCNGASSSCNAAGYAMETACHTGKLCVYDVVTDKGWNVNVLNHRIHTVIDDIILKYNDTPECVVQPPCRDCFNWRFVSHDDDEDDEPKLPNPLLPHRSKSRTSTFTSASTSVNMGFETSVSSQPPQSSTSQPPKKQKCLKRAWYGWCSEWGDDDEE
ncbi:hypothetical protein CANTEDRAFT_108669 [Yamadazyma tenuis ATCC 10573]|uniref:Putative lipase ATG15 n=1 Tax=Candida tenuis (strain ATCC 10573 / BCRC 21748 / CBS 615 / JCM 9827 / NBRC 10315 / NRRL Y-1498 / VKM Y-70) TaxID=590646 RepID=G3BBT9_CANTC|nr:uncharacterized protein CANTEDRAFT_108669 [Yamadazyma tenuis ATCC 10573]EGV62826.1 hypothetical protein CANTEDRAFT_108669 [Yamadazyma tenuis ATCC 10573]